MTEDSVVPIVPGHPPRFMTEAQLRSYFGLTERALRVLRATRGFPARNEILNRTDSRLVDRFFDRMSGLESPRRDDIDVVDGKENFDA